jgi:S-adenosylmethionine:tRNA ribosyltransferase-isomerase
VDVALFDYHLPGELIAQFPLRRRQRSRLLILDRSRRHLAHARFSEIPAYFAEGDVLVVNNTKVFKARLIGRRATGARVEILLVRKPTASEEVWQAMVTPSRRVREGEAILFEDRLSALLSRDLGGGYWRVVFSSRTALRRILARHGHVPLPPYISRNDQPSDIRRYQTVYARSDRVGAVAAPTAGFHFTRPLLAELAARGIRIAELTLHVGPGTFKPITAADIAAHTVDPEYAELSAPAAVTINRARDEGKSVFVVGTTSVRTLEAAPVRDGHLEPFTGMIDLYIKPGHRFRWVDHLITNFHLPRSSLLVLVSALAGRERILEAYREAVAHRYRFYSYGDAMLIL